MTTFRVVNVEGKSGWHLVNIPSVSAGQQLIILPLGKLTSSDAQKETEVHSFLVSSTNARRGAPNYPEGFFSGVEVVEGDNISITAAGEWNYEGTGYFSRCSADGNNTFRSDSVMPAERVGKLLWRIGMGSDWNVGWNVAGTHTSFVANISGPLYFIMNDRYGSYSDNQNHNLAITVKVNDIDCDKIFEEQSFENLIAKIDDDSSFFVGERYDQPSPSSGKLYLSTNGCSNNKIAVLVILNPASIPQNEGACEAGIHYSEVTSVNPIKLRTGEKIFSTTDLKLQTVGKELSFVRYYNSINRMESTILGPGWSHNHAYSLSFDGVLPSRIAYIRLPEGNQLQLNEISNGLFSAGTGSNATLEYDAMADEYMLLTPSHQAFVFDGSLPHLLRRRSWENGKIWSYSYDEANSLLSVDDGDGRELKFAYWDGLVSPNDFKNGLLWHVGDHTSQDLATDNPSGRYVEFDYFPEKQDGLLVPTPKALLKTVQDIQGKTWQYDYYGQYSGEILAELLNIMTQRVSPSVDQTGDGIQDDVYVLENLSYLLDGNGKISNIIQQRGNGLLENEFAFSADSSVTSESNSGLTSIHHFAKGTYLGKASPDKSIANWQVIDESHYRSIGAGDANGNITALGWSADGKQLEGVTDALGNPTSFTYDTEGRLSLTVDAQGRKTQYEYNDVNNDRLPSHIKVYESDGITLLSQQEFDYDASGRVVTERQMDPADGSTILSQTTRAYYASGNGAGLLEKVEQYDTADLINPDSTTTYTYDALGRVIKVARNSLFGTCKFTYTVYDPADNVLASACGLTNVTPPTTVQEAIALYDANDSQKQHTRVTVHEYDSLGRRVKTISNAGTAWERTSLTVYDALDRVIRTIQNYVADAGIPNPYVADRSLFSHGALGDENRISETVYNERGQVRKQIDALDNATLYGYDDAGRLVKTVVGASLPAYDNTYSTGDPDLSDYGSVSPADDEDLITEQAYDPAGNLVMSVDPAGRTTYTVYDALNRPMKVVANAKPEATLNPVDETDAAINDPRRDTYVPSEDPDQDHISETTYDALGRVVRTRRLVDVRGATDQWETTLFGYDTLGQQVRTIRFAATPDYDVASDPQLAGYQKSPDADVDLVTETVFDPAGRVMYTQDITGQRNWTAYDGLGRAVKQIRNAVGEADTEADDPRSSSYIPSLNPDEDLITLTTYNGDGQVIDTYDVLGRVTTRVYDLAGRQSRMVRNHVVQSQDPMNWVWSETNHRWELKEDDSTPVERSSDPINQPDNHDINLVSETVYDEQGRAIEQWDHLRRCQRTVFDTSGRVVMTIRNYISNSQPPENWAWSTGNARWEDGNGTAIDHGLDGDRNQISTTRFDADGRVSAVRDTAGRETRYAYDKLGRRVTTIANYVDGVFDPASPDEDLITQTVYDKSGQVIATIDSRGTKTAFQYDSAGRQVLVIRDAEGDLETQSYTCYDKAGKVLRAIANYEPIPAGDGVPADAFGDVLPDAQDENGVWYWQPDETLSDAQIVTQYVYDSAGRRIAVIDPLGNTTQTMYGKDGQVQQMMDAENITTAYRYDLARRRTMVVQNYTGGQLTEIDNWSWNDQSEAWESNQS